jgi:DNA-binding transcriptional LysR family regulator
MGIDLRQLRYFITVAEELHFGRAAARLHMTQPPLSQSIQALEAALDTPLFLRTQRRVELAPAGVALLPEARRLLDHAAMLPEIARRAASGASGHLTLAFVSTADYNVLPTLLREFREAHPQVELSLREATSDVQIEDLLQGRTDAGLLIPPLPDRAREELNYLPLLSEPLVLVVPSELRSVLGKKQVFLEAVAHLPLIIFPRRIAPALHDSIIGCFRQAGLSPRIGQEAIQMQTIVGLVSAGMGMALVPQSVSNLKRPGVDYRLLADPSPVVETGLAWRSDNRSPALQTFLHLLRKKR